MNAALSMWVVYDHPRDFPDVFVARRWDVSAAGSVPTRQIMTGPDLSTLREHFRVQGLAQLARSPGDDSKIVETWL